jgi:hypothetical protein
MVIAIAVVIYVVFCVLTGLCGSQRRLGFIGTFILSLLLTPVIVLPILMLTGPSRGVEWRPRRPQGE